MNSQETFYPESRFGGFTDIDGTVAFYLRVNALTDSTSVVLDLGCGRGAWVDDTVSIRRNLTNLRGKVAKVIGIDVDPEGKDNTLLDEFRLIESDSWPVESNSIDVVICDNVVEHIEDPDHFFSEISRVIKNNGFLCLRTPNRWGYVALLATLIPNKHHAKVTSSVQDSRKEEDVFPTYYKCNSFRRVKRIMSKNNFNHVVYGYEAEPSYLNFSKIAYFFGKLHQKFAPAFLKLTIFAFGQIEKTDNE